MVVTHCRRPCLLLSITTIMIRFIMISPLVCWCNGQIVINEVATASVTTPVCGNTGQQYIELYNLNNATDVDISSYVLKCNVFGCLVPIYTIPEGTTIATQGYVTFCRNVLLANINSLCTIGLFDASDHHVDVIHLPGPMFSDTSSTYSRRLNGLYHTTVPTPNTENIFYSQYYGTLFINEVASEGTIDDQLCNGNDWVELINTGSAAIDFGGFVLHDNRGPYNAEALVFQTVPIFEGDFFFVCRDNTGFDGFLFDIDNNDTITLLDNNGNLISTTGSLTNGGSAILTYQRTSTNNYVYGPPSQYSANTVTEDPVPA